MPRYAPGYRCFYRPKGLAAVVALAVMLERAAMVCAVAHRGEDIEDEVLEEFRRIAVDGGDESFGDAVVQLGDRAVDALLSSILFL